MSSILTDSLYDILASIEMTNGSGLVFTDSQQSVANDSELIAIEEAKKFGARAIYFRRVLDENTSKIRFSIPQIYIYDIDFNDSEIVDLHRKLWSSGNVPFFYIVTNRQLKIFSCTKKANINEDNQISVEPLKEISIISNVVSAFELEKFSTKLFDNGSFWQQDEYSYLLDPKNSPYETLLSGLLAAKKDLIIQSNKQKISTNIISKLLIMCILVKYLEEKKDENNTKLFSIDRDFLPQFTDEDLKIEQFTDILRYGKLVEFFTTLSLKFSGNVFHFTEKENTELKSINLNFIADIFDAKITSKGQYVLWELYSFNHLPIELISGIYEAFLKNSDKSKKNKGVVYTPPYLVNFLVDECMPLDKALEYFSEESYKILDPACGSGIFLVSAFKRLVQWKAIINYKLFGKFEYPDLATVKRIIRNNIFGVDIEEEATRLTIFSLSIAVCDKLSPMQIWKDLQFDDLSSTNIHTNSFFDYINGLPRQSFDLVIGNPPFNPPGGISNGKYFEQLVKDHQIRPSAPIQDKNLALLFLDRSMRFPKIGKSTCLILPSGAFLYNNNSHSYRKHFLQHNIVDKIIDFTHLSDTLFYGRANVAVCAIIARNNTPSEKLPIDHIVVHRSKVAEERYFFEIDYYDYYSVRYSIALESLYVWKTNLLGGGRLLRLIERLAGFETINDYLKKKKTLGWVSGEGYIISDYKDRAESELLNDGFKKADYITNCKTVVTDKFDENGIGEIDIEKAKYFLRPRDERLYRPPHILIKENLGKNEIPIVFSNEYLCFKDNIIGIHAPYDSEVELKSFYKKFKEYNPIYRFYLISTSGKSGISMSNTVLLKKDILNLPFPENENDFILSSTEKITIDDVENYWMKSGQSNEVSPLFNIVSEDLLNDFGQVFCNSLNSIYKEGDLYWQTDSYIINDVFTGYVFRYGEFRESKITNWENNDEYNINNILYNEYQKSVRITRVLKIYLHIAGYDIIILIKPSITKYWLLSIALRDTEEIFSDLKYAGF